MADRASRARLAALLILVAIVFVAGYALSRTNGRATAPNKIARAPARQGTAAPDVVLGTLVPEVKEPTPAPDAEEEPVVPIYTAEEAIAHSLELFPANHNAHDAVARLLTLEEIDAWRQGSSPETEPQVPAWVVGILGDGVTDKDIFARYGRVNEVSHAQMLEGAFYVWDANGGDLFGIGGLKATGGKTYESLAQLPNRDLPISPATPFPAR